MPLESESKRTDASHEFGIKVSAIQKAQAAKGESSCLEDLDLISRIDELKSVIENHR